MKSYYFSYLIPSILILNLLIYFRAVATIEEADLVFAECARNSGRTSALINLILLIMLGHWGLMKIVKDSTKMKLFIILTTLFTVNHLIHFFFVAQNFSSQSNPLSVAENLHGFITFLFIIALPILIFKVKKLNSILYYGIIFHFFNVTYMIADTFYARFKPVDPAYLHRIGVLIMIVSVVYVVYRMLKERRALVRH